MNKQNKILEFVVPAIIIAVLASACGAFSGYYFGKANSPTIYAADIKKITDEKKGEMLNKLKQGKDNPDTPATLEKEYEDYLKKLDVVLDAYKKAGTRAVILRREAVIEGAYTDITGEIRQLVNAKGGSKVENPK
jgi:membrane protein YqaA with SNARE-associated domain